MLVDVENSAENGRATRLRGDPDHPVTRGFLCGKVAQYLEREYSPDRLLYPQKRIGAKGEGRFKRISWDEALDTIARRLAAMPQEYGPESILPYSYGGTMGLLNGAGMDRRFFHRLGASRLDRTICSARRGGAGCRRRERLPLLDRARAVPRRQADHRVGRKHSRNQRSPVAFHRGGAAQGRQAGGDRPGEARAPPRWPTGILPSTRAAIWRWRWA